MQSLSDWVARVSRYCGDPDNGRFSTDDVTDAIVVACDEVWETIVSINPFHYHATYNLSTVADQESYDLPPDFERPLALEDRENVSATGHGVDHSEESFRARYIEDGWDIRGDKLCFHNVPSSTTTDKWRLHYVRRIPALIYGTADTGSTTASIVLGGTETYGTTSNQDDYYNNSRILIVSGTGAGSIYTISDYDGGTKVATLGAADAVGTNSIYSILSGIPDHSAKLVCFLAAIDLLSAQESPNLLIWVKRATLARRDLVSRMLMRLNTDTPGMSYESW